MPTKQEMLDKIYEVISDWYDNQNNNTKIIIIWHPVMIWDILDYIWEWPNFFDENIKIVRLWVNIRKPIDDQPIECIEYVYNLCK